MKKRLVKFLVSLSVIATAILAVCSISANAATMYVSGAETGSVYLRKSAASSSYYMTLSNGTAVNSIGWARGWDGVGYTQVQYGGYTGWITSKYLSSYYSGSSSYYYNNGVISGAELGAVWLRTSPASSSYYTTIYNGSYVKILGWQKGWDGVGYTKVQYNGYTGWVTSRYCFYR